MNDRSEALTTSTDRSRWLALVVLCVGMLMVILDQTIVNVALPSIQADLGFSAAGLAWVVNGYLIAFGGLLLLGGILTEALDWHWIFFVNVPIGAAAFLFGLRLIAPERGLGLSAGADLP